VPDEPTKPESDDPQPSAEPSPGDGPQPSAEPASGAEPSPGDGPQPSAEPASGAEPSPGADPGPAVEAGGAPAPPTAEGSDRPRRQARNYLLQPFLQVRLGIYHVVLSAAFALAILGLMRAFLIKVRGWLGLAGVHPEMEAALDEYLGEQVVWLALISLIFLVAAILVTVIFTHRLVGPTYAFRRHINRLIDGDYSARTQLRDTDAFDEVAADLNRLSEALEARANG